MRCRTGGQETSPKKLRKLYPTFAEPIFWRDEKQGEMLDKSSWLSLRKKILERDGYTCQYCDYRSEKYQVIHHLDENPNNNVEDNLVTVCQMCNLILHSGQGCVIKGVVDLYKESNYSQNEIIRITREMRDIGKSDEEIIKVLGLKGKMPFKMDKTYLRKLYGFVTSRPTRTRNDMYDRWKEYHFSLIQERKLDNKVKKLRKQTIYFAHPKWLYDTLDEEHALQIIHQYFGNNIEIINPKKYDHDPYYSKQKKSEGMDFCFKLVGKAESLVFQPFTISADFKEFIQDYLAHVDEYGVPDSSAKMERDVLSKIIKHRKIMTPGVSKEIEHALSHNIEVYEVKNKKIKKVTRQPRYFVLPLKSYQTLSMLRKAHRSKSSRGLFPPFWWLKY